MQEQCDTAPVCGFFIREESLIPLYVASRRVDFSIGELGEVVIAILKLARHGACPLTPSLFSARE